MTNKEYVLDAMCRQGRAAAVALQERASGMTGTEMINEENYIPEFNPQKDYSGWKAGSPVTDEGQVWLLIIPHNAANYPDTRPSANRACWGLAHTTNPSKAKPWVASYGTSGMYMTDEHCTYQNHLWRSRKDNNSYSPGAVGTSDFWEDLGEL